MRRCAIPNGRNKRCVWNIPTRSYKGAHFAVYPEKLIEIPISAGCPRGGIVLDPFMGSGTTGVVAKRLGRKYLGLDINKKYCEIAEKRINSEKTKCTICGIPLENDKDFCETCFDFLKQKYPNKRKLKQILQWHKNHTKLNQKS